MEGLSRREQAAPVTKEVARDLPEDFFMGYETPYSEMSEEDKKQKLDFLEQFLENVKNEDEFDVSLKRIEDAIYATSDSEVAVSVKAKVLQRLLLRKLLKENKAGR